MNISRKKQATETQALAILIVGASLLRLFFAQTGLGIDETYTVATSRHLHLSFFDHPPLAWWLSWLMQTVFHSDAPTIVRLPFVGLSAIATWQMYRLTSLLYTPKAGLFAATAFVCAPALGMTAGTWVLPDGPLIVGLLAGALCLAQVFFSAEPKRGLWIAAGFWGGIALLSKYHGIFLFGGTLLFVLSTANLRYWLKTVWPYLGGLIGIIIFSPVLFWNSEHHWVSFIFQSNRANQTQLHIVKPFLTLLGQALFLTPWLWLGLVIVAVVSMKKNIRDLKGWFLLCLAVPQILLFTLAAAGSASQTLYHWAMPGYLFLLPLLGDWLARLHKGREAMVDRIVLLSGLITCGLVSVIVLMWFMPADMLPDILSSDPLVSMRPIQGFDSYLTKENLPVANLIVAPSKWYLAGQFDYVLKGTVAVTCFCDDAREYGIIAPLGGLLGKDFAIPMPLKNAEKSGEALKPFFDHLERLNDFTVMRGETPLEKFAVFYGRNFNKVPSQPEEESVTMHSPSLLK